MVYQTKMDDFAKSIKHITSPHEVESSTNQFPSSAPVKSNAIPDDDFATLTSYSNRFRRKRMSRMVRAASTDDFRHESAEPYRHHVDRRTDKRKY